MYVAPTPGGLAAPRGGWPCDHASASLLRLQPSSANQQTSSMDSALQSASALTDDDVYDYLTEPNENLICPICRNPFIDPVMCESTDHVFCRICLIKSLEVSPTCPIDRLPLSLSLVSPAPKIINKLVDELLVSCPFKSKLGCPFVCQRDLIAAHLRSHQAQLDHPYLVSSISRDQDSLLSNETSAQRPLPDQHPSSTSSRQLRFQWLCGRATLVNQPQDPTSPSLAQTTSTVNSTENELEVVHCPFERFGCSFMGTPELMNHQHLTAVSDLSVVDDNPRCPFLPVQEILYWFEHLEVRNVELKEQLSQSIVQRSELTSVLDNLKASFRQLWYSHQSGDPNLHLDPPTYPSLAFGPTQLASAFPHSGYPHELSSTPQPNQSMIERPIPDLSSPTRRSSDSFLHMNSSRMNYDSLNGHRLKHFEHYPSACPNQFYRALGSPSSSSKMKIRVSTFLRRDGVVTLASDTPENIQPLHESSVGTPSQYQTCISSQNEELTDPLKHPILIEPAVRPSSPFSISNIQSASDADRERANNHYHPHSHLSRQVSTRQPTPILQALQSEPSNEGLLSRKISELLEAIQTSLTAWKPYCPIVLPNDLGTSDRPIAERRRTNGRADKTLVPESMPADGDAETKGIGSSDHQSVLSSLEKIEKLMADLIEQRPLTQMSTKNLLEDPSKRASPLASSPSSSSSSSASPSAPIPTSVVSLNRHTSPSTSRSHLDSFLDDSQSPSGPSYFPASSYSSSIRPMKL